MLVDRAIDIERSKRDDAALSASEYAKIVDQRNNIISDLELQLAIAEQDTRQALSTVESLERRLADETRAVDAIRALSNKREGIISALYGDVIRLLTDAVDEGDIIPF